MRLQRGSHDSTWRAVYLPPPSQRKPRSFIHQYVDDLRRTFARAREQGLLEAVIAERVGRVLSPQSAGSAARGLAVPLQKLAQSLAHTDAALRTIAVAAVLIAAAGIRILDLGGVGFNSDEAVYSGQAGALIGDSALSQLFSVFRAHPLLLQTLLGGLFAIVGISDLAARLFVSLAFGVGSVALTYLLAYRLYGHRVGIAAATIMAVLPYHVLVSRQVLIDTPLGFFVLLTLWCLARGSDDRTGGWIIAAGLAAGLATATKETGVLLLPVIGAFLIITGGWRRLPFHRLMVALALFAIVVAPYPLSRLLIAPGDGSSYFLWQISRPANHDATYFLGVLAEFAGIVFVGLALLGLIRMATRLRLRAGGDVLVLLWVAVFFGFFQVWPTKLLPYLMPVIPALAICAAVGLDAGLRWIASAGSRVRWRRWPVARAVLPLALVLLGTYLGSASFSSVHDGNQPFAGPLRFNIEVQDFAGGREFGYWAKDHTPPDAKFLTIGPSIGNILRFYGHRDSLALSVSPDPSRRNPAYVPVPNPDLWFRQLGIHYIVWDFYSADRSAFYNARLMHYVRKYGGSPVYGLYERPDGSLFFATDRPQGAEPRIVVYDAIGGEPLRSGLTSPASGPGPTTLAGD